MKILRIILNEKLIGQFSRKNKPTRVSARIV